MKFYFWKQEEEIESSMLRHSHSPSVVSWRCALRFPVLHYGLCVQSPPGCHFWPTQLLLDLAKNRWHVYLNKLDKHHFVFVDITISPSAVLQNLVCENSPISRKTIQSIINHFVSCQQKIISFCTHMQSHTAFHGGSFCLGECWWYFYITKSYFLF